MKALNKSACVTVLVIGSLVAGMAQASAVDGEADARSLIWVGPEVASESAPAGKVAHYLADPKAGTIEFKGFVDREPVFTPRIAEHNPARSGDCTLSPTSTPYASYGFSGTGTKSGSWSNRKRISANDWFCAATYHAQSGGSSFNTPVLAPGAYINWTSTAVVTQVRITG